MYLICVNINIIRWKFFWKFYLRIVKECINIKVSSCFKGKNFFDLGGIYVIGGFVSFDVLFARL